MTSEAKPRIKITYATLKADNEELHSGFEEAVDAGPRRLRRRTIATTSTAPGATATGTFEVRSPIDRDIVLGTFATGTTARRRRRGRGGPRRPAGLGGARRGRSAWRSCAAPRSSSATGSWTCRRS